MYEYAEGASLQLMPRDPLVFGTWAPSRLGPGANSPSCSSTSERAWLIYILFQGVWERGTNFRCVFTAY